MLTVLKLANEPERSFVSRLFSLFSGAGVNTRFGTAENVHYLELTAMMRNGEPDWRMIAASALDPGGRILAQRGVRIPECSGLARFVPSLFARKMLENLALDVLVQLAKPPQERRIVLYGRENELCALLPIVYRLVGEICVLTRRPYAIADAAQQLREQTGTSIIVSGDVDVGKCDILLAPSGGAAVLDCSQTGLVIAPDAHIGARRALVDLPPVLEDEYDDSFDVQEFTAAFYELAGLRALGRLHVRSAVTDKGELSPAELAQQLDDCAGCGS